MAVDFIDCAIFTYERAFVGSFNFSGANRLDFSRVENRPFLLTLHRQTIDQQRRGVFCSAFEWAGLLWSIDLWPDPSGASLHLDFSALKSGMHRWLLDVLRVLDGHDPIFDVPGWGYAKAPALRANKDEEGAKKALDSAVRECPSIDPLLVGKCDIAMSGEVRGHRAFRIFKKDMFSEEDETLLHLSRLYVQRYAPLCKDPAVASWIASTVESVTAGKTTSYTNRYSVLARLPARTYTDFAHGLYRHVVVLGTSTQRLLSYTPQSLLRENFTCDPLPPSTAQSKYDETFFTNSEDPFAFTTARRPAAAENRLLERVFGEGEGEEDGEEVPGLEGAVRAAPVPPVAHPAEDFDEEEDAEDEEEAVEDVASASVRALRNFLGLFWGGSGRAAEDESSEGEEGEEARRAVRDDDVD